MELVTRDEYAKSRGLSLVPFEGIAVKELSHTFGLGRYIG